MGDPEETRLVQRGSPGEFCTEIGLPIRVGNDSVTAMVTWARSDFLMLYTPGAPEGPGLGGLRKQFPAYDCATLIPDPSAFALQLDKDIGKQFEMNNV